MSIDKDNEHVFKLAEKLVGKTPGQAQAVLQLLSAVMYTLGIILEERNQELPPRGVLLNAACETIIGSEGMKITGDTKDMTAPDKIGFVPCGTPMERFAESGLNVNNLRDYLRSIYFESGCDPDNALELARETVIDLLDMRIISL